MSKAKAQTKPGPKTQTQPGAEAQSESESEQVNAVEASAEPVEAPVADGYVRVKFVSLDEREVHGVRDIPLDNRGFRVPHNNKLYEQGRQDGDGSWIYHDRGL